LDNTNIQRRNLTCKRLIDSELSCIDKWIWIVIDWPGGSYDSGKTGM